MTALLQKKNCYCYAKILKRKDEIAGLISKTILSSDIAYIPEESNTPDAEEPGPSGTTTRPLCSVSVPSGQPEKEIKTEKRQSKKKGKGKGKVRKKEDFRRF